MKRIIALMLCTIMLFAFAACEKSGKDGENVKGSETAATDIASDLPDVVTGTMVFKDFGTVKFELYPNKAKQSTLNFIYLAKSGFYDGIVVHRLVKDFVIQAGAYTNGYQEKSPEFRYTIKGEFSANGIENTVKHVKGALSWARPTDYDGASTQFFICTDDRTAPQLDGNYAAFGMVTEGFEVLDKINDEDTAKDVPLSEIVIESVTIDGDFNFPEPDFIR